MIFGEFDDGSGYVFNDANPSGVKYLSAIYFREFKKCQLSLPVDEKISAELAEANLLEKRDSPEHRQSDVPKQKAFTVWFHVSNDCNLSCSYCYIPNLNKAIVDASKARHSIHIDTAKNIICQLFDFCRNSGHETLQLKFSGGEPLLAIDRIKDICQIANELSINSGINVSYRMLTNGVLVSKKVIEILSQYRFGISISLDGGKEEHDRVRFLVDNSVRSEANNAVLRQGTWEIVENNIDKLILAGIKPYLLCTVTPDNHHSLFDVATLCSSRSIGFRFSLVRDKKSSSVPDQQEAVLGSIISVYERLGDTLPVTMPLERFARFGELDLSKKKTKVCGVCNSTACIDNTGQVSTCQMNMAMKYGIPGKEKSFEEIFSTIKNDKENKMLVHPYSKTGPCKYCTWRFVCAGGCPEHTRMVFGELDRPSPWCLVYRGLLPIYVKAVAKQIKRAVVSI